MLSHKAKYALRALQALASAPGGTSLTAGHVATHERIPLKFLENILAELKHHGLLASKKGKGGGYVLNLPASQISLAQVIRLIDGPIAYTSCVSLHFYERCPDCPAEATCRLRHHMARLRDASLAVLENTFIQDLA